MPGVNLRGHRIPVCSGTRSGKLLYSQYHSIHVPFQDACCNKGASPEGCQQGVQPHDQLGTSGGVTVHSFRSEPFRPLDLERQSIALLLSSILEEETMQEEQKRWFSGGNAVYVQEVSWDEGGIARVEFMLSY